MTLPSALVRLAGPAHRTQAALVTDFDGTLAPIVDDPTAARPLPSALAALVVLARELRLVAVISGRPVAFLAERIPIPGVELIGQYGVERLVDGEVVVDERVAPHLEAVAAAAAEAEATWPDLLIERKGGLAVAVHWRTAPEREPVPGALDELARRHGLAAHPARMAVELRPPLPIDKGSSLRAVWEAAGQPGRVAFAGDDRGDLVAFAALDRLDAVDRIRIAVRSPEAPPELIERADVVVDGADGVAELLGELAAAVSERR